MNIYQAGYYRLGKQGDNSGWQLVYPTEGMSQTAIDGFKGIASHLAELKNSGMPDFNVGIFSYDRFVYIVCINYKAVGEDSRGVSYVHCYCMGLKDFYEIARTPEKLFSVADGFYYKEYVEDCKEMPLLEDIPYVEKDVNSVLAKYGISLSQLRSMVLGAISFVEGESEPLCIKKTLADTNSYLEFYNDIMFAIYSSLPLHLRIKLTTFSYKRGHVNVYVSDEVEGSNYIDLDTNDDQVKYSRLSDYQFTKLYNDPNGLFYNKGLWEVLGDTLNKMFDNTFKGEIGCRHEEAVYQEKIKKDEAEGIEPERAVSLLTAFLGMEIKESVETYAYLADLLAAINSNRIAIEDKKVVKDLGSRYDGAPLEEYRQQLDAYNLFRILANPNKDEVFNDLYDVYKNQPKQFSYYFAEFKEFNPEYAFEFTCKKLLPNELKSVDKINQYVDELSSSADYSEIQRQQLMHVCCSQFVECMNRKIDFVQGFDEFTAIARATKAFINKANQTGVFSLAERDKIKAIYVALWEKFDIRWFDENAYEDYEACELEYVSEYDSESDGTRKAQAVIALGRILRRGYDSRERSYWKAVEILVLKNSLNLESGERRFIQEKLFNNIIARNPNGFNVTSPIENFDVLLGLAYDCGRCDFDIVKIAKILSRSAARSANDPYEAFFINRVMRNSNMLSEPIYKRQFTRDIEKVLEDPSRIDQRSEKGLKRYLEALNGKELKVGGGDGDNNYFDTLYRLPLTVTAIMAYAVFCIYLHQSYKLDGKIMQLVWEIVAETFGAIVLGGAFFAKCIRCDGVENLFEDACIDSVAKAVIYFSLLAVLIAIPIVLFLLLGCGSLIWVGVGYLVLSTVLMIISDFIE